jgi:hypothetical protein
MRRTALIIGLAAATAAGPAAARTVLGAGALSCERWSADRQAGEAYVPSAQWVLGYLSRADRVRKGGQLHAVGSNEVITWLDQYCGAHPRDGLETAAYRLEIDIAGHALRPPPAQAKAGAQAKAEAKAKAGSKEKASTKAHAKVKAASKPKAKPKPRHPAQPPPPPPPPEPPPEPPF